MSDVAQTSRLAVLVFTDVVGSSELKTRLGVLTYAKLLARHDPHPVLFDAYAATLPALTGIEEEVQAALRAFELVLLREVGLLPDLAMLTATTQLAQAHATVALLAPAKPSYLSPGSPVRAGP